MPCKKSGLIFLVVPTTMAQKSWIKNKHIDYLNANSNDSKEFGLKLVT